uniref:Major capsid protein n=1 Tax=Dulem virus 247 TaxID=3145724 RepID=A0AAU8AX88_9VIRU
MKGFVPFFLFNLIFLIMGVFSAKQGPNMDAKRNTFDLSFSNNLTMQFGKIYPVFVKPCDPGDSFNIKASFGLNFLPTVYPVQTPMKAYLHFFYCRNRTVWDDFMNFYTMKDRAGQNLTSSEIIPPYIDSLVQPIGASELSDYMGIPILDYAGYNSSKFFFTNSLGAINPPAPQKMMYSGGVSIILDDAVGTSTYWSYLQDTTTVQGSSKAYYYPFMLIPALPGVKKKPSELFAGIIGQNTVGIATPFTFRYSYLLNTDNMLNPPLDYANIGTMIREEIMASLKAGEQCFIDIPFYSDTELLGLLRYSTFTAPLSLDINVTKVTATTYTIEWIISGEGLPFYRSFSLSSSVISFVGTPNLILSKQGTHYRSLMNRLCMLNTNAIQRGIIGGDSTSVSASSYYDVSWYVPSDSIDVKSPYYSSKNPTGIRLSSLPFRHYEAIYNYFYRDNRNNPLRNDAGDPIYNEVLLNTKSGVEPFSFKFHYHNWEQDFLTTCVQEPQLGVAPLVGISSLGEATFSNDDGSTTTVQLTYGDDGNTVTGWKSSDGIDAPVAQSLIQMSSQGISISDFRNVNAFQTWLEVQMRKTLRFGDSIQGHFNVNPRYDDYLYPEFIGGVTQDVDTYQVNQTVPTDSTPLGSYAGQAICKGSIPRSISKFCDEPGYIIGLLSLVPRPVYSQILPKHFLRHETLDYHFPEFNNISYQPVTYREVCPVQAFNEDPELLDKVFGYQRPWYDLISSIDEAHGQFLKSLQGFVLRREFIGRPELSSRFLEVHPEDLNDIFATRMTDSNDVILGQLYFDVKKKTTISKFGIPSLQV